MIRIFDFLLRPRAKDEKTMKTETEPCKERDQRELEDAQHRADDIEERMRMLKVEKEVLLGSHPSD